MQSCNDALAQTLTPDPPKCGANARAYARNESVVGVVGTPWSGCTERMLPVLNQAPGGAVSLVSTTNSHVDLVRRDPTAPADRLQQLYPTGQRGYARMLPSDDYEAAAGALYAQRISPGGIFYIQDWHDDPWAKYFSTAALRLGLPILGTVNRDQDALGERWLAQRVRASGARAIYIHGTDTDIGTPARRPRLRRDRHLLELPLSHLEAVRPCRKRGARHIHDDLRNADRTTRPGRAAIPARLRRNPAGRPDPRLLRLCRRSDRGPARRHRALRRHPRIGRSGARHRAPTRQRARPDRARSPWRTHQQPGRGGAAPTTAASRSTPRAPPAA